MSLTSGARLGPYEVLTPIGTGGMGEVYRATDTHLGRQVAIKVLPDVFAQDAERVARFEREAKTLASLNHPNIAAIYGVEHSGGIRALVMELVEGPTLADRIVRGALPLDEALPIARQIAEALEAAHEQGIVHRDLKPANIKVRDDGTVKVLDFGLAKAFEPAQGSGPFNAAQGSGLKAQGDLTNSPTLTSPAISQLGLILGTAAYMSPEQAKGRVVDQRADVWAFGAVLFEMLSGRRAFDGDDMTEVLGAVVRLEPDWNAVPHDVPPRVRQVIRACLQKNMKLRAAHMQDVRLALDGAFEAPAPAAGLAAAPRRPMWHRLLPLAGAALAGAVVVATVLWPSAPAPRSVTRFELTVPAPFRNTGRPTFAVSPDGRRIVYNTGAGLYLRSMDELEPRLLPGTTPSLSAPFFSPDGQSVGFYQSGQLRRLAISGGAPVIIAPAANPLSSTWAADGTIFVAQPEGILRVPESGGTPQLVVRAGEGELLDRPQLLPDGDSLLFTAAKTASVNRWDNAQVVVQSLRSGARTLLIAGGSDARYLPSGHLIYALDSGLFAVRFDVASLAVQGGPVSVAQGLARLPGVNTGAAGYEISSNGTLFHVVADSAPATESLAWVDRLGKLEPIATVPAASFTYPRLSSDGRRLVVIAAGDVRVYDLDTGHENRITTDGTVSISAEWSPDNAVIAYSSSRRDGRMSVWTQAADGSGAATQVTHMEGNVYVNDWAPDARTLGVTRVLSSNNDVLMVPVVNGKASAPQAFADSPYTENCAAFSPDGRHVAYVSNETGQYEVYIRPFPGPGARTTVSVGGGVEPEWARHGEVFYRRSRDGKMMVVSVTTSPTLTVGAPRELFETVPPPPGPTRARYAVSADGKRFLMATGLLELGRAPRLPTVRVVEGWTDELKRLVPVN